MIEIGYTLSSEEHAPNDLVRYARKAEETGFTFALISDHYHPWVDRQGHSPFVWSVIGAIAHATTKLRLGTGVTCPTMRIHPAIIAQAAATSASMIPAGSSSAGDRGEPQRACLRRQMARHQTRLEMLEEAVEIIRLLWEGGIRATSASSSKSRRRASTRCPKSRPRSTSRATGRPRPSWRERSPTGESALLPRPN